MAKVVACIIARTNSTRLPQKVLRKVNHNMMLIDFLINKIKKSKNIDEIYLCTSIDENDKILLEIAGNHGINGYAGSLDSVIDRMLEVGKLSNATEVIRITGDNIFTDEVYLDIMIEQHLKSVADYTRTENLPVGITGEIINVKALEKCYSIMPPDESQYLMLYMFQPNIFNCLVLIPENRHSKPNYTLTVDTPEDFERTLKILNGKNEIDLDDIINKSENFSIPNLIYKKQGMVKFPANLILSFESFRVEMNNRIKNSTIYKVPEGLYSQLKK